MSSFRRQTGRRDTLSTAPDCSGSDRQTKIETHARSRTQSRKKQKQQDEHHDTAPRPLSFHRQAVRFGNPCCSLAHRRGNPARTPRRLGDPLRVKADFFESFGVLRARAQAEATKEEQVQAKGCIYMEQHKKTPQTKPQNPKDPHCANLKRYKSL